MPTARNLTEEPSINAAPDRTPLNPEGRENRTFRLRDRHAPGAPFLTRIAQDRGERYIAPRGNTAWRTIRLGANGAHREPVSACYCVADPCFRSANRAMPRQGASCRNAPRSLPERRIRQSCLPFWPRTCASSARTSSGTPDFARVRCHPGTAPVTNYNSGWVTWQFCYDFPALPC